MRTLLVLALLSISVACTKRDKSTEGGPAPGSGAPARPLEPVAKLSALQLWEEYGDNPIAADGKYKGKAVEVTGDGKIVREGEGYAFGFATVAPVGLFPEQIEQLPRREQKWYHEGYPPNVIARLSKEGNARAANIKPDDTVALVGIVRGSKRANVFRDYVVELDECVIRAGK